MDYSITWNYIVEAMKQKGIPPESTEKFSYGEIIFKLDEIWNDYFDKLWEREQSGAYNDVSGTESP